MYPIMLINVPNLLHIVIITTVLCCTSLTYSYYAITHGYTMIHLILTYYNASGSGNTGIQFGLLCFIFWLVIIIFAPWGRKSVLLPLHPLLLSTTTTPTIHYHHYHHHTHYHHHYYHTHYSTTTTIHPYYVGKSCHCSQTPYSLACSQCTEYTWYFNNAEMPKGIQLFLAKRSSWQILQ